LRFFAPKVNACLLIRNKKGVVRSAILYREAVAPFQPNVAAQRLRWANVNNAGATPSGLRRFSTRFPGVVALRASTLGSEARPLRGRSLAQGEALRALGNHANFRSAEPAKRATSQARVQNLEFRVRTNSVRSPLRGSHKFIYVNPRLAKPHLGLKYVRPDESGLGE
jgi:hypothetical protein